MNKLVLFLALVGLLAAVGCTVSGSAGCKPEGAVTAGAAK